MLDGSKILAPGTIQEKCESGHTETIIAEYADHLAFVSEKVQFGGKATSSSRSGMPRIRS